jgi:hypothetical protein
VRSIARSLSDHFDRAFTSEQPVSELVLVADAGEALFAALEEEGQLAVVKAEELENRGMHVVDVPAVFNGTEAELIGGADDLAALDAAARKPGALTPRHTTTLT